MWSGSVTGGRCTGKPRTNRPGTPCAPYATTHRSGVGAKNLSPLQGTTCVPQQPDTLCSPDARPGAFRHRLSLPRTRRTAPVRMAHPTKKQRDTDQPPVECAVRTNPPSPGKRKRAPRAIPCPQHPYSLNPYSRTTFNPTPLQPKPLQLTP